MAYGHSDFGKAYIEILRIHCNLEGVMQLAGPFQTAYHVEVYEDV